MGGKEDEYKGKEERHERVQIQKTITMNLCRQYEETFMAKRDSIKVGMFNCRLRH